MPGPGRDAVTGLLRWRQGRYLVYQDVTQPLPWLLLWPGRSMAFRSSGQLLAVLGEVLSDPAARDPTLYRGPVQPQRVQAPARTGAAGA